MAYRIVSLLNVCGENKFFIQKRYKFLFFRIWITLRDFRFPFPHKLYFLSKMDAKEFISEFFPTINTS